MKKNKNSVTSTILPSKEDITKCYGVSCESCQEQCSFKAAGCSVISDERHSKNVSTGTTRIYNFIEDFEEHFNGEFSASPASPGANILRLFYWSLKAAPKGTMAILERAFEGKNQSDEARQRGVTRQAISKLYKGELSTLAKLLGVKQFNLPESRLWRLNTLEFKVMQAIHNNPDISERQMAEKIGCNQSSIHRAKVSAMQKLHQTSPSKTPNKRITEKQS